MSCSLRRAVLRSGAVLTVAAACAVVSATPAFAHVTAQPGTAAQDDGRTITTTVGTVSTTTAAPDDSSGTDTAARWLRGAGLLVGALGVGVGGGAVLRTRRRATERAVPTDRSGADL